MEKATSMRKLAREASPAAVHCPFVLWSTAREKKTSQDPERAIISLMSLALGLSVCKAELDSGRKKD